MHALLAFTCWRKRGVCGMRVLLLRYAPRAARLRDIH